MAAGRRVLVAWLRPLVDESTRASRRPRHAPSTRPRRRQMAGRAGRRGLDSVGYVVYAPTLSVAGLRNLCPLHEMNRMLTADVMGATSQLVVDRPFVLRHVARPRD